MGLWLTGHTLIQNRPPHFESPEKIWKFPGQLMESLRDEHPEVRKRLGSFESAAPRRNDETYVLTHSRRLRVARARAAATEFKCSSPPSGGAR